MDEFEAIEVDVIHEARLPGARVQVSAVRWSERRPVEVQSTSYCFSYILKAGLQAEPPILRLLGSTRYLDYGWLWFAPPEMPLMVKRAPNDVTALIVRIDPDYFHEATLLTGDWYNERSVLRFNLDGAVAFHTLDMLAVELASSDPTATTMIAALVNMFLVQFARIMHRVNEPAHPGGLSDWQHLRIRQIVTSRLAEDVSADTLAKACGISTRHLLRSFKNRTGLTVHQYVEQVRVERCRALLGSSDLTGQAIAALVGFSSSSHMGMTFRKHLGMTPGEFRRRQGAGKGGVAIAG